ncbi:NADH dehydrogenase [ubiquinone] 1 alpha subcomplex assembly factor 3 [Armigeres subalbatus]|uniref:NADH dehydrogenase [ubiquinone] 1 alpha subcomplex assembly factor 3 n=1 Tax=Armigeres subalbatus TaxID=124917 RepID=UPI002ED15E16
MQSLLRLRTAFRSTISKSICTSHATLSAYEGDGRTSVSILNKEADAGLLINSFSQVGFRLSNDMKVIGPMAIFPRSVLSWNVEDHDDISEESLSLFTALEPKIDILIVGIGDQQTTPAFTKKIIEFMKKYRINVEVLSTEQACATFNFLNAEGRVVAAALIPPVTLRINEDDLMRTHISTSRPFQLDEK